MASSSLVLHRGAREVTRAEIESVPTPAPTATHYPIPFVRVLDMTLENLRSAGFVPTRERLALHGSARFFATIDMKSSLVQGITLAAALRSSHDRSIPYGFVAGSRCFCCDNLSLTSDMSSMIRVKHSKNGEARFMAAMGRLVKTLPQFIATESARIKRFQQTSISDTEAESLIVRSYEKGLISYKALLPVLREFRTPSFEEFSDEKSLWRLENAYTTCLGHQSKTAPNRYARMCIGLQSLLAEKAPAPALSTACAA